MKKSLSSVFLILVFLTGLSLMLYPSFSNTWNLRRSAHTIANYDKVVSASDSSSIRQAWADAKSFAENLNLHMGDVLTQEQEEAYNSVLNLSGTGVMGYIDIPSIDVELPIYHGTSEDVLVTGVGHISWSSLPMGGEGTHCSLSAHRGLPSAKLFTDIDQLVPGDLFVLSILDKTLTYEVDQILIVLPEDVDALRTVPGQDYCTLITCTPYGVNTHRLLVRGHRVENVAALSLRVTADAVQIQPALVAPFVAAPVLILLLILLFTSKRKSKSS